MRIPVRARSVLRHAALLFGLFVSMHAVAGIQVDRFGYTKFISPSLRFDFLDSFDANGPLDSGSLYDWQVKVGTIKDKDEDFGLHFKPSRRGDLFSIGSYVTRAQILELQTPLIGDEAINNAPSFFFAYAVYELDSYGSTGANFSVGVGLTDVFRGGTRAIAATVERDGGSYYGKFSNPLTGEIWDRPLLDITEDSKYVEVVIERENFNSNSVRAAYAVRNESFFGTKIYFEGLAPAFSDVVLSPVLFAAAPIPEAETWALLLVGLAVVGCRVRSIRR
jgi:hypothetical protein